MRHKAGQRKYNRVRFEIENVARERIQILLGQAREFLDRDPKLARRYVELAWKISMRTKVRIPHEDKRFLCKGCGLPLIPGRNARVRIISGNPRIVITCLSCGRLRRYPLSPTRLENLSKNQ